MTSKQIYINRGSKIDRHITHGSYIVDPDEPGKVTFTESERDIFRSIIFNTQEIEGKRRRVACCELNILKLHHDNNLIDNMLNKNLLQVWENEDKSILTTLSPYSANILNYEIREYWISYIFVITDISAKTHKEIKLRIRLWDIGQRWTRINTPIKPPKIPGAYLEVKIPEEIIQETSDPRYDNKGRYILDPQTGERTDDESLAYKFIFRNREVPLLFDKRNKKKSS